MPKTLQPPPYVAPVTPPVTAPPAKEATPPWTLRGPAIAGSNSAVVVESGSDRVSTTLTLKLKSPTPLLTARRSEEMAEQAFDRAVFSLLVDPATDRLKSLRHQHAECVVAQAAAEKTMRETEGRLDRLREASPVPPDLPSMLVAMEDELATAGTLFDEARRRTGTLVGLLNAAEVAAAAVAKQALCDATRRVNDEREVALAQATQAFLDREQEALSEIARLRIGITSPVQSDFARLLEGVVSKKKG